MRLPHTWSPRAREMLAVVLLCAFLFGWIGVSLVVTVGQIRHNGFGSGVTDRAHLPEEIKQRYRMPDATTPAQVMEATSR